MPSEKKQLNESYANRILGLDIMRSIAILLVVYEHGYFLIKALVSFRFYGGWLLDGVSIFFVLSGFLIGGIFIKAIEQPGFNGKELFHFWIRRWFRTLPNYFLILCLLLALNIWLWESLPNTVWKYFLFVQNIHDRHPNFFPEAWSLSVEEWFYLFVPFCISTSCLLLKTDKKKTILFWIAVIIVACTAVRFYRAYTYVYADVISFDLYLKKQVITRLDSIMFGFLGAYLKFYHSNNWSIKRNIRFIIGCLLLCLPAVNYYIFNENAIFNNYFTLSIVAIGSLLLLPKLSTLGWQNNILNRYFTYTSKISYSMYLVHFSLIEWTIMPYISNLELQYFNQTPVLLFSNYLGYWILTYLIATLLYKYYETKMTALRDKFRYL